MVQINLECIRKTMWNADEMWLRGERSINGKKNEGELDFFRSGKAPTIIIFCQYFMNFRYFLRFFFSPLISSFWYPNGHPRIDRLVNTKHDAINCVLHVLCIGREKQHVEFCRSKPAAAHKSANMLQPRSTELANTPIWATFQESNGSRSHLTGTSLASLCQREGKD